MHRNYFCNVFCFTKVLIVYKFFAMIFFEIHNASKQTIDENFLLFSSYNHYFLKFLTGKHMGFFPVVGKALFLLFKTTTGQRSFSYRIVNIWNSLPTNLKLCYNVASFESNLRRHLLKEFLNTLFLLYHMISQFQALQPPCYYTTYTTQVWWYVDTIEIKTHNYDSATKS